jgi:hypothetical protein
MACRQGGSLAGRETSAPSGFRLELAAFNPRPSDYKPHTQPLSCSVCVVSRFEPPKGAPRRDLDGQPRRGSIARPEFARRPKADSGHCDAHASLGLLASNLASTRGAGGSCSAQPKHTGSPLMRITVCALQPTQSAGSPKEYFTVTPSLFRVWGLSKETKMAYPGWDGALVGTRAKAFRAVLKSKRMTRCRVTIATAGSVAPSGLREEARFTAWAIRASCRSLHSAASIRFGEYLHGKVKASEPKKEPQQERSTKVRATLPAFSLP